MQFIDVCISPELIHLFDLSDKTIVIIDILRASSTITTALESGAKEVVPVSDLKLAKQYKDKGLIVGAERGGKKVDGFIYGNSPFEYMGPEIKNKSIVITIAPRWQSMSPWQATAALSMNILINILI